ncbi:MAG: hypothetical protein J6S13_07080, partial [Clostridia bacterium]|nr:hypothetical protein [Clostridia bacterium]
LPLETEFKLNTDIAYKIDFRCTKAAFNDDTVWRDNGEDYKEIATPTLLQPEDFPKYKSFKQKFCEKTSLTEDIDVYQPFFAEEYAQCVCGFPFEIGSKCAHCGLNVEDIANIISFENLVEFEKENIIKIAESRFNAVKGIFEKSKDDALEHAKSLLPADDNDDYEYAIICYEEALEALAKVPGWKDADELAKNCNDRIKEIKAAQETERLEAERLAEVERQEEEKKQKESEERAKRNRKLALIILLPIIAVIIVLLLLFNVILPSIKYNSAISYMDDGEYTQAINLFEELGDYSDSQAKIVECNSAIIEKEYQKGLSLLNSQDFDEALKIFEGLGDYKDSHTQILETKYQNGLFCYNKKDFENSNLIFKEILNYKDSKSKIHYHEYAKSVTTQPTCDKEGTTTLSCKNCSYAYTEPIVAKGHAYKETVVLKPTCTTTGTKDLTCSECNYTTTETIKATGHSYTSKVTKQATCELSGTKTLTCKCGDSRTESIKATGHNYSKATCTSPSTCSKCKKTNGTALGHTTSTSVCSRCKYNFMKPITITDESSFRDYGTEWKKYPIPGGTYKITISLKEYNYFESEKFHTFALRKNDLLGDVIYLNNSLKGELVETKYITSSEDFVLFTEGNAFSVKIIVEPVN